MKENEKNIVKIDEPKGGKDGKWIMSMYQLRVDKTIEGTRQVCWCWTITCWCRKCVIGDYDNCVEFGVNGSGWNDLATMTKEETRHQKMLAKLTREVYDKDLGCNWGQRFQVALKMPFKLNNHA